MELDQPVSPFQIDDQSFLDNDEIYSNVKKIISSVIANRDSWPFRNAVNEIDAPNYHEIIKIPMDLSIINKKIDDKIYSNFNQLEYDMRLIVNNSELYNGAYNGFTTNVYACWRLFRKQTKKYLDQDLSLEDKEAFIFAPRYNFVRKSDSVKRKKYKKQKKHRFQALELLYNATQTSIESTFQQFVFSPNSDSENNELNFNQMPKKYQFLIKSTEKSATEFSTGFYNEAFANLDNYSYQNGFYTEMNRNENLVFKSLNEWNKQIYENGRSIILPEKSIFVDNSPVDINWLTNFPNDQPHYKTVFNENLFQKPIDGQLHNGQLMNRHSIYCKKEKVPKKKKCKENSQNSKNRDNVTELQNCKINHNLELKNDDEKIKKDNLIKRSTNLIRESTGLTKDSTNLNEKSTDLIEKSTDLIKESTDLIKDATSSINKSTSLMKDSNDLNRTNQEGKQKSTKKRLVIKLSKMNNDWKPISLNDNQESGSESDSLSDSSTSSSSCSCDSD